LIEKFVGNRHEKPIEQQNTANRIENKGQNHRIVGRATKPSLQNNKIDKEATKNAILQHETATAETKTSDWTTVNSESKEQFGTSIENAFALGLKIKKNTLNENSYPKYKSRVLRFQKWLEQNDIRDINSVDKKTVVSYLNSVLERTSPRNRNNARATLSSLFTTWENNEIIPDNFILKINVLKAVPERNKTFTPKLVEEMNTHMDTHDPDPSRYADLGLKRLMLQIVEFISGQKTNLSK